MRSSPTSHAPKVRIQQVSSADIPFMESLASTFGEAFDEVDTYSGHRPSSQYLQKLLTSDYFIALVAIKDERVVGGIAAYELIKFEQERTEIYIYDLAVASQHRREGIAMALLQKLQEIAKERGAYVMYVQADAEDGPAIELYTKLGSRADVLHFDFPVNTPQDT